MSPCQLLRRDPHGVRGHRLISRHPDPITCPGGFTAGSARCGLKPSGANDLALIRCDRGANAAALFTRNRVRAAPIEISQRHLASSGGRVEALLINSGIANAATGPDGLRRAERTVAALAARLGTAPQDILVNSTGVIGVQLPDESVVAALPDLVSGCTPDGLLGAAEAIMTTDTVPKIAAIRIDHDGRAAYVAGIAKGSGMVHPDMATMIAVLLTDAAVESPALDAILRSAMEGSFHRITVDGETSTNDAVFALASGCAGEFPEPLVREALSAVARELAIMVVRDGEGAQKLIHVRVGGASTGADALAVARAVASSLLVRTAVAGCVPNWGRIVAAVGHSGAEVDPARIDVRAGGVPLFAAGRPAGAPERDQRASFAGPDVLIEIGLNQGEAADEFFSCDLTGEYVRINAEYTT